VLGDEGRRFVAMVSTISAFPVLSVSSSFIERVANSASRSGQTRMSVIVEKPDKRTVEAYVLLLGRAGLYCSIPAVCKEREWKGYCRCMF
jgi:hypothetical protein